MENNGITMDDVSKALDEEAAKKVEAAKARVAKRKEALKQAQIDAGAPIMQNDSIAGGAVLGRFAKIKDKPIEPEQPNKKKQKNAPTNAKGLALGINQNTEKMKKEGVMVPGPSKTEGKDDKKSPEKEKAKEERRAEATKKQEEKMKKYENIELPGGMRIKQENSKWTLYDDKGRSVDVTEAMEKITKLNKDINAANKAIDQHNAALDAPAVENALPKDDKALQTGNPQVATDGKVTNDEKVSAVTNVLSDDKYKDVVFKDLAPEMSPEAIKAMSETAIDFAEDKELLDKLKDPKQFEEALKDLEEKDKKNKNRPDRPKAMAPVQQVVTRGDGR